MRPKLFKKSEGVVSRIGILFIATVLILFPYYSDSSKRKVGNKITCVVIDAGHGGHDSGCLGAHAREKDVALAIALKLGKFIEDNLKDVKVVYTRKTDKFIGLDERAAIANKNKADLFICIHCNSGAKAAYGIETYVMGLHKSEENLAVAKRENSVVILEKDYKKKYEGFDPDSPEGNIIFSMYQNAYLDQSLRMSTLIQKEVSDFAGRSNRGVKQAGFLVLWKSAMPSILIETGFLTNAIEERYLISKEGQDKIAFAVYRSFAVYKNGTEPPSSQQEIPEPGVKDTVKKDTVKKKAHVLMDTSQVTKPESENNPEPKKEIPLPEAKTPVPVKLKTDSTEKVKSVPAAKTKPENQTDEIYFTVQIATSGKMLPQNSPIFKGEENITSEKVNGLYKFMTGKFSSLPEALTKQRQLRSAGFPDAFVVAYHDGVRITVPQAESLLKKN